MGGLILLQGDDRDRLNNLRIEHDLVVLHERERKDREHQIPAENVSWDRSVREPNLTRDCFAGGIQEEFHLNVVKVDRDHSSSCADVLSNVRGSDIVDAKEFSHFWLKDAHRGAAVEDSEHCGSLCSAPSQDYLGTGCWSPRWKTPVWQASVKFESFRQAHKTKTASSPRGT